MTQTAIFGGGCFWCTEAIFQNLRGVSKVLPGYAGGSKPNPTYEDVCRGDSGHVEVISVEFDPKEISFEDLLNVFFATHDPTTLNRQGADIGEQYASVVFYTSEQQKTQAESYIQKLEAEQVFGQKIVTQVKPAGQFFPAENYHQNYYNQNQGQPYCQAVISPKLVKFRKKFEHLLKS